MRGRRRAADGLEVLLDDLLVEGVGVALLDHDRDTRAGKAFADKYGVLGQPGYVILDSKGNLVSETSKRERKKK